MSEVTKTLLGRIAQRQAQEREQDFISCLIKAAGLEKIQYWRDSSGEIHLRMMKKLKLGISGASFVKSTTTLIAKVSFQWLPSPMEEYVLARVVNAVADLPLLETFDHDIAAEEWLHLQEELQNLLDDHKLFKCQGLVNLQPCEDCKSLYGNPTRGGGLALKLARYDLEFRKGVESDDDEFDPRDYVSPG